MDQRVGDQRELAGCRRGRQGRRRAREVGGGGAAAVTGAAVVAGGSSVVALRQHCGATDGDATAHRVDLGLEHVLAARHRHRRQEFAVGQDLDAFAATAHPDEALDLVVVRSDVGVGDRPVVAVAVVALGLEVVVAHAVRLATPHDGAAADLVAADPPERPLLGEGERVIDLIGEERHRGLFAGVVLTSDRAALERLGAWILPAAQRQIVRQRVLAEVGRRIELAAELEHRDAHACFAELLRRPAAIGAGSDHDRVVALLGHVWMPPKTMSCGERITRICRSLRRPARSMGASSRRPALLPILPKGAQARQTLAVLDPTAGFLAGDDVVQVADGESLHLDAA